MNINQNVSFAARIKFDSSINQRTREEFVRQLNDEQLDLVRKGGDLNHSILGQVPYISDMEKNRDIPLTLKIDEKANTISAELGGKWDDKHEDCRIAEDKIYGLKVKEIRPEALGQTLLLMVNRLINEQVWKLSAEERAELDKQRAEYWQKQKLDVNA